MDNIPDKNDSFDAEVVHFSSQIVAAYVSNNNVSTEELPSLIDNVSSTLMELSGSSSPKSNVDQKPAVPIKKSLNDDYIICLEDGLRFKSMKRHLRVKYGMTPAEYRAKWDLPHDYPMVSPAYSVRRSKLAKTLGLGKKAG